MKKNLSKIILYVIGIFLAVIYVAPYYILVVNAFKTKRELFESTLKLPNVWTAANF